MNFLRSKSASVLSTLALITSLCFCVIVAGCAADAKLAQPQSNVTPAQVAAIACPPILVARAAFDGMVAATPTDPSLQKVAADLAQIRPVVNAVCTVASGDVTQQSINALALHALPVLEQASISLPITPTERAHVEAGLAAARMAVAMVSLIPVVVPAVKAP